MIQFLSQWRNFTSVPVLVLSWVHLCVTPWTAAHQAPLSIGISQTRILEWVAISSSRGFCWPWDRTSSISCLEGGLFITSTTWEASSFCERRLSFEFTPKEVIFQQISSYSEFQKQSGHGGKHGQRDSVTCLHSLDLEPSHSTSLIPERLGFLEWASSRSRNPPWCFQHGFGSQMPWLYFPIILFKEHYLAHQP